MNVTGNVMLVAKWIMPLFAITVAANGNEGAWSESMSLIWDTKKQEYNELPVKVWDSQPNASRRFNWEGSIDEEGYADGKGKLQWKESDAPDYGPEGLISVYVGDLKKGKRGGNGKVRFASGASYDGAWENDAPSGWGEFRFANGDYYQGSVVDGRMQGKGTYVSAGSEIFEGEFQNGKRNGKGKVEWPGGFSYESEWVNGMETPESLSRRKKARDQLAGAGDSIEIGLVSAVSKNEEFRRAGAKPVTYESYLEEGEFGFRPEAEFLDNYRSGGLVDSYLPEIGSLFMELAYENNQSRQVLIERGEVEVLESIPDLAPYIVPWPGASDIRFDLANAGWGGAKNCVFDFNLHRSGEAPEPGGRETYEFQIKLGDFEERLLKVDMTEAFEKCGVDVDFALKHKSDSMQFLGKWGSEKGDAVFGRFAKYNEEGLIEGASVDLHGRLTYEWENIAGEVQSHSVLYTGFIQLIYLVEGGDAMGGYAKYDVALSHEGEDYRRPFPFSERVEPFRDARFALDIGAERSSFHRFRVALYCSDGTILRSPVCRAHFFRPRNLHQELSSADGPDAAIPIEGNSPYLFPDSHQRLLEDDELRNLSADELWRARNEIFARRGYIFGSDRGKALARNLGDLYKPVGGIDEIEPTLNATERSNIEAIRRYE